MNDFSLLVLLFSFALAGIAAWAYFNTYWGVYDSLANSRVGDVYSFFYAQPLTGDYQRYLARVVSKCTLDKNGIKYLNQNSNYRRHDEMFERSPTLLTCQMKDGSFRQFYGERASNVRRCMVGKLLYSMGLASFF